MLKSCKELTLDVMTWLPLSRCPMRHLTISNRKAHVTHECVAEGELLATAPPFSVKKAMRIVDCSRAGGQAPAYCKPAPSDIASIRLATYPRIRAIATPIPSLPAVPIPIKSICSKPVPVEPIRVQSLFVILVETRQIRMVAAAL